MLIALTAAPNPYGIQYLAFIVYRVDYQGI